MTTDPTVSVSRGVFVSKGNFQKSKKKNRQKVSLFEQCYKVEPWYTTYKQNWNNIEQSLHNLNLRTYNSVLSEMVSYICDCYNDFQTDFYENLVPGATLLTGVNQPDHLQQFSALVDKIRLEATPHIATVHSQDAPTIRHLVEGAVYQLVSFNQDMDLSFDADESMENPTKTNKIRKTNCTMSTLCDWYSSLNKSSENLSPRKKKKSSRKSKPIVVILPDFESFSCEVLQDFVTIVSSYTSILPIVLVFGVATSVSAIHKSFPYHVSSKLLLKVFQSHSSTQYLNQVLEEVFLTPTCPFHLSGRAFELFTDVFLFYDFSVIGFTRSIKYCMMEHHYGDNVKSLCCPKNDVPAAIARLSSEDLERVRRFPSFRPYVEAQDCRTRIDLIEDDNVLKSHLERQVYAFHEYLLTFHTALKILFAFVRDLPRSALGKQIRELYVKCTSEFVTKSSEFRDCIQLLKYQSKHQLVEKLGQSLKIINSVQPVKPLNASPLKNSPAKLDSPAKVSKRVTINEKIERSDLSTMRVEMTVFLNQVSNASLETSPLKFGRDENTENVPVMSRLSLKESLLKAAKTERVQSEFELIRSRLLDYMTDFFSRYLQPPHTRPVHEIFVFNDVASVKKHIIGAPRGAIHTALNNPVSYLQCSCCELSTPDSISPTLPDTAIAYKLHLECGKLINLYDWLQAFAAVVDSVEADDEERRDIPPDIQARFTRAVAELQFLGFIKASKRKTDHVTRLTW